MADFPSRHLLAAGLQVADFGPRIDESSPSPEVREAVIRLKSGNVPMICTISVELLKGGEAIYVLV